MQASDRGADPVAMCQFLTKKILSNLESREEEGLKPIHALNLLRILDMYRHEALEAHSAPGILAESSWDEPELGEDWDQQYKLLRQILDQAKDSSFPDDSKEELVVAIKDVLERRYKSSGESTDELYHRVLEFLKVLRDSLEDAETQHA